jgi:hypothetical protein
MVVFPVPPLYEWKAIEMGFMSSSYISKMWHNKLKLWESYGNLSQSEANLGRLWRQNDGRRAYCLMK